MTTVHLKLMFQSSFKTKPTTPFHWFTILFGMMIGNLTISLKTLCMEVSLINSKDNQSIEMEVEIGPHMKDRGQMGKEIEEMDLI
jgi:hypothetical protein